MSKKTLHPNTIMLSFNTYNILSYVYSLTYTWYELHTGQNFLFTAGWSILRFMVFSYFKMSRHLLFLATIYGLQQKQLNSKRVQQLRT